MSSDRPTYSVYGLTPNQPFAFTVPPVEARPDQPLPDAGLFLRICAGVEAPTTVLMRCAHGLVGEWRHVHEHGRDDAASVDEQLNLLIWFIDREAGGHTKEIAVRADAPTAPSSYGQWVAWLVWRYVRYALRQNDPQHCERDAAELTWCIEGLNQIVADVRAGRVRLPEQATEVFPPRLAMPESGQRS
ncbi:hypothetical protein [Nocardia bovistercoris]|uniref:Uncharacterized protein n=1 Tax=Nocardia bovistercoris TaxID=2785916 RepID=A0A931IGM0_9NOCA|nr:hypothetical protein [Nocardia bovistercoris]MBH0779395.1 hypothetical protein [Nocardia bovistercoris]